MKPTNVVLSGFMASGKSTVGALVADILGMRFIDTDAMIERREGRTVRSIFEAEGEPRFRELERSAVREAAACDGVVIAAGGGAVVDRANVKLLRERGVIYHLSVSAEEALRRAGEGGGRPLLGDREEAVRLLEVRAGTYAEARDVMVDTEGKRPEEIARWIAGDFEARASRPANGRGVGNGDE